MMGFSKGQVAGKGRWVALFAAMAVFLVWGLSARPATAQEEAKEAPAAAAAPAEEPAKAEAPAAGAEGAAANEAGTEAAPAPRSLLRWAIEASGPIGFFLLGISIYFLALVVQLFLELNEKQAVPPALVESIKTAIKERRFQDAYDACKENESPLAKQVRAGIAQLANGKADAKEAIEETNEEIVAAMESRISYLATIGTLGPMIGLVGTIMGMIFAFQEIATSVGTQPRPEKVAEGISTALFITLEGVAISVPAIFFFAFFRNRVVHLALHSKNAADRLINSMLTAAKQPATAVKEASA